MRRVVICMAVLCAGVLLAPATASAQTGIAGVVKDTTGAVMPGVTVEASSPALIEKSRVAISDSAGQYKIVDLPPGTYAVTFTLAGFKAVKRTDILLEGTFTAQINADLQVGAMEETLTVTAESPTVDVITNQKTFVANREILDSIPTPVRNTPGRALLIPGTTVTPFVLGQFNLTSHGSATSDFTMAIDGLRVNNLCGSGQYSGFYMNDAAVQELSYATGSESAEIQSSGIRVNQVPKDGGNRFSGIVLRAVPGQRPAVRQPHRCDEGGPGQRPAAHHDRRHRLQLPGQSVVRRPADERQGCGSTSPTSTRTARSTCRAREFADGSQAYRNLMGNYSGGRTRDVGGLEQGQDSRLHREAVQRRVLQRLQHAGDDRRPKRRPMRSASAGFRRCGGHERSRTSCCSKPGSPTTTSRTSRTARAPQPDRDGAAEAERLHGPA